jgi:hypothetical protein
MTPLRALASAVVVLALSACGPRTFTVTMNEDNSSGQTGTATLTDLEDGTFRMVVDILPHPTEDTPQLGHIHTRRCGNIGDAIAPLNSLVEGQSDTTFPDALETYTASEHAINIHLASDGAVYVSCGNMPLL